jgi:hypothetical protein
MSDLSLYFPNQMDKFESQVLQILKPENSGFRASALFKYDYESLSFEGKLAFFIIVWKKDSAILVSEEDHQNKEFSSMMDQLVYSYFYYISIDNEEEKKKMNDWWTKLILNLYKKHHDDKLPTLYLDKFIDHYKSILTLINLDSARFAKFLRFITTQSFFGAIAEQVANFIPKSQLISLDILIHLFNRLNENLRENSSKSNIDKWKRIIDLWIPFQENKFRENQSTSLDKSYELWIEKQSSQTRIMSEALTTEQYLYPNYTFDDLFSSTFLPWKKWKKELILSSGRAADIMIYEPKSDFETSEFYQLFGYENFYFMCHHRLIDPSSEKILSLFENNIEVLILLLSFQPIRRKDTKLHQKLFGHGKFLSCLENSSRWYPAQVIWHYTPFMLPLKEKGLISEEEFSSANIFRTLLVFFNLQSLTSVDSLLQSRIWFPLAIYFLEYNFQKIASFDEKKHVLVLFHEKFKSQDLVQQIQTLSEFRSFYFLENQETKSFVFTLLMEMIAKINKLNVDNDASREFNDHAIIFKYLLLEFGVPVQELQSYFTNESLIEVISDYDPYLLAVYLGTTKKKVPKWKNLEFTAKFMLQVFLDDGMKLVKTTEEISEILFISGLVNIVQNYLQGSLYHTKQIYQPLISKVLMDKKQQQSTLQKQLLESNWNNEKNVVCTFLEEAKEEKEEKKKEKKEKMTRSRNLEAVTTASLKIYCQTQGYQRNRSLYYMKEYVEQFSQIKDLQKYGDITNTLVQNHPNVLSLIQLWTKDPKSNHKYVLEQLTILQNKVLQQNKDEDAETIAFLIFILTRLILNPEYLNFKNFQKEISPRRANEFKSTVKKSKRKTDSNEQTKRNVRPRISFSSSSSSSSSSFSK